MRPAILFPIFAASQTLQGVGPKMADLLQGLEVSRIVDLLFHLPASVLDRRDSPGIAHALDGSMATFKVMIDRHEAAPSSRAPYKIICHDQTGFMTLVFFRGRADYLLKTYPIGEEIGISGTVTRFKDTMQMTHPDRAVPAAQLSEIQVVEPVYPLRAGLTQKAMFNATRKALEHAPDLEEWHDAALVRREAWPSWRQALKAIHTPEEPDDIAAPSPARRRLAYDELLSNQLALQIMRRRQRAKPGRVFEVNPDKRAEIIASLPYDLTDAQQIALSEIDQDMSSPSAMMRLLQGDVGSGKTIMAFLSLVTVVNHRAQGALMAPTEILARQHYDGLRPLCDQHGLSLEVLTGRDKGKNRQAKLMALMSGEIDILVGTHALFQDDVIFKDLGLVVVDEQHRFGVHQRLALSTKSKAPDVLVMTATPIPRTLSLTAYGDMDVSRLTGKPPGRKPVDTRVMPLSKLDALTEGLEREIARNGQIFWVCPRVNDEDGDQLTSVEERYAHLSHRFGARVGFVHGQMSAADKDAVMERFVTGEISILVATTVIEVGVNVPNATIMVIENADRFGLAQLHQLRGRVGRGDRSATCVLLYDTPLGDVAKQRLETLRTSDDGFFIAERDLELRGAGEVLGTKQSGLPTFKLANISEDGDLMAMARDDAEVLLSKDPHLETPRGQAIRTLLYLFERDKAIQYLRSG